MYYLMRHQKKRPECPFNNDVRPSGRWCHKNVIFNGLFGRNARRTALFERQCPWGFMAEEQNSQISLEMNRTCILL